MSENYERLCADRATAYQAAKDAYTVAQLFIADAKPVWIRCTEDVEPVTLRQHRFFHGPVLQQISEQVRVNGERYTRDVWKRYFKDLFLEAKPRYEMLKLPGQKRATPRRQRWSTRELGIKRYSQFIDETIAHAATEWSVAFRFDIDEREAVRYRPKKRLAAAPQDAEQPEEVSA